MQRHPIFFLRERYSISIPGELFIDGENAKPSYNMSCRMVQVVRLAPPFIIYNSGRRQNSCYFTSFSRFFFVYLRYMKY